MDEVELCQDQLRAFAARFEASRLSGADAVALLGRLGVIRRLVDGLVGTAARRVAETDAHVEVGDRSVAELCARLVGIGPWEARRTIETATKLERLPLAKKAVREGRLSGRAAEMIASAACVDPTAEGDLVDVAGLGMAALRDACVAARARVEDPADRTRRQHAARSLRMWTNVEGMLEGHFRLAPEVGSGFKAVIDAEARRIFRSRRGGSGEPPDVYAADALTRLVCGDAAVVDPDDPSGTTATGVGRVVATVHVVVDHEALVRGNTRDGERCEVPGVGPVNVGWAREMLGDAFVTAIVAKGRDISTVAHLGRHVPAELRTAMIVSGRECAVQGCSGRDYLEIDHSDVDWARGGPTAKWNLAWLCSVHHRRKSAGWCLGPPDPVTGKRALEPPSDARAA